MEAEEFAKSKGESFFITSGKEDMNIKELYSDLCSRKFTVLKDNIEYQENYNLYRESIRKHKVNLVLNNKAKNARHKYC